MKTEQLTKKAIEAIVMSMQEIHVNLQSSADDETVKTNAAAMLALAEAFIKISGAMI
jgi:hypothetical protein